MLLYAEGVIAGSPGLTAQRGLPWVKSYHTLPQRGCCKDRPIYPIMGRCHNPFPKY